ncbi:MAG: hypothetical protein KF795_12800 [Labilithrix sp.]|nr:hypothetical protein [Labilithrix sp.]
MRTVAARLALPALLLSTAAGCTVGAPAAGTAGSPGVDDLFGSASAVVEPEPVSSSPSPSRPAPAKARWTVFVYANGDNGRSPALEAELAEMNRARLGEDVAVVVFADWNAGLTDSRGRHYPSGSEWISLRGGGAAPIVQREHEKDFDDPAVLRDAIARAFEEHPADHYGFIMWSRGEAGDTQDGTRAGAAAMSTPATIGAVREGLAKAGLTGERALDMIGFDSYAPARVEVAYAMRDVARVYIANPASVDGTTWAYADALGFLAENRSATGASFAAFEAEAGQALGARPHVAIHTEKLESLADATSSLVHAIAMRPDVLPRVVAAIEVAAEASPDGRSPSYRRFASKLAETADVPSVAIAAENVVTQLAATFVQTSADAPADLGITLPLSSISPAWAAEYLETARDWRAASGWDALLTSFEAYFPEDHTDDPDDETSTLP